jgi:hypothetical protein
MADQGQSGGPDWGDMGDKLKAAKGPDRLILIAGLLFFIDSFLPWFHFKVFGISANASGWSYGGLAVISILLGIAGTAVAVAGVAGMKVGSSHKQSGQILLGLCGGALVFAVLRWITHVSLAGWALYVGIILTAVMTYGAWQKYNTAG